MNEPQPIHASRGKARQRANRAAQAKLATVAQELMDGFNHGKRDPSQMAVNGHDTQTGYQFFIDRDGDTIRVTVDRDWS